MPQRRWDDPIDGLYGPDCVRTTGAARTRGFDELDSARLRMELVSGERARRFATRILVYMERLARADRRSSVVDALTDEATGLLHGSTALAFDPRAGQRGLTPRPSRVFDQEVPLLDPGAVTPPLTCGSAFTLADLQREGLGALGHLMGPGRAASLAFVSPCHNALIVLFDRREATPYDSQDLYVLRALARQAQLALARIPPS